MVVALAVIWSLTAVNCRGVGAGGELQNVFSLLKLVAVGVVIAAGLGRAGTRPGFGGGAAWWPDAAGTGPGVLAMGAALRYAFFAYSGWEGATYVAEEVRDPERNLPRSILLGISGVMVLYLAANAAYLNQLSVGPGRRREVGGRRRHARRPRHRRRRADRRRRGAEHLRQRQRPGPGQGADLARHGS